MLKKQVVEGSENVLENQNTEFKAVWKDEFLKWICGMANANGGIIYRKGR